ncbi:MAG: hypothetical protein EBX37_03185 [Alphaproteobacteria bacterium]|nr:hypothetical protein [Alphaproteobacteria bacterium]
MYKIKSSIQRKVQEGLQTTKRTTRISVQFIYFIIIIMAIQVNNDKKKNKKREEGYGMTFFQKRRRMIVVCTTIALFLFFAGFFWSSLSLYIRLRKESPYCPGYLDPRRRFCSSRGTIEVGDVPESECNPSEDGIYNQNFVQFFRYLMRTIEGQSNSLFEFLSSSFSALSDKKIQIVKGNFLFATEELLRILPSDFGQNNTTPYGILSFFESYLPCVQDPGTFCRTTIRSHQNEGGNTEKEEEDGRTTGDRIRSLCEIFLTYIQRHRSCDDPISSSSSLFIQNRTFFDQLGLLGSFSLTDAEIVLCNITLPLSSLPLNYWSVNVYRSEDLTPGECCYPYRQVNLASLCPPLNAFHAFSDMKEEQGPTSSSSSSSSPLTRDVTVMVVLVSNPVLWDDDPAVRAVIARWISASSTSSSSSSSLLHVFRIPSAEGSMVLSDSLPNPNRLSSRSPLFRPKSQRLSVFLRLSPDPAFADSADRLREFVNFRSDQDLSGFQVCKLRFPSNNEDDNKKYPFASYPPMIAPPFDEKHSSSLSSSFDSLEKRTLNLLRRNAFRIDALKTRNSIVNIFAPMDPAILNGTLPYRGGFQAIQVAGNAQADNYDSQYRLSEGFCLEETNDAVVGFLVNHSAVRNVVYNSVNLVDVNKAFGYAAVNLTYATDRDSPFYLVVASRNYTLLQQIRTSLQESLSASEDPVLRRTRICPIWIQTGPSIQSKIPLCHQLMLVERLYLNTNFASVTDLDLEEKENEQDAKKRRTYNLHNLFGDDLRQPLSRAEMDDNVRRSLVTLSAPLLDTLLPPLFYRATFSPSSSISAMFSVSVISATFMLLFLGLCIAMIFVEKK